MNFFKRIGNMIYMLFMVAVGVSLMAVMLNILTVDVWAQILDFVNSSAGYSAAVFALGAFFIIAGVTAPFRLSKQLKKNRVFTFQNSDGEVTVSLSAIEDYIKKIARIIPEIKDVRSRVTINKKGINLITSVSMSAASNIPEVTELMQIKIKNSVQAMLGGEEKINVKLHINKIFKEASPQQEAATETEESQEEMRTVPFREIE